jgi:hypothetical protein
MNAMHAVLTNEALATEQREYLYKWFLCSMEAIPSACLIHGGITIRRIIRNAQNDHIMEGCICLIPICKRTNMKSTKVRKTAKERI